jgi:hypothetical protein
VLARGGLVDEVLAASVQLPFARVFNANLELVSEIAFAGAGCRWEFQCSLPQWRTERATSARRRGSRSPRSPSASAWHGRPSSLLLRTRGGEGPGGQGRYVGACRGCGAYAQLRNDKGDAYRYCKRCHPGAAR